ncbi:hypothetical protein ACB092_11G041600 [Castanea dentata]
MLQFYPWPVAFGTTNYTYLAIFRTFDSLLVWYTSQGIPITNDFDQLTLENNAGSLEIRRHGGNPIELSSSPQPTNNTVASLLDSGDFVFNEVYSNGSKKRVLWKSFDYPGKVLLPGMKLGVNYRTGQNWSLRAWLTDDYPVPGAFTLEYSGHQLIIRRRSVVYWKSGVLRGNEFENIPPKVTSMYHFIVVSNGNEESFSFMSKNGSQESRWLFSSTGKLLGDDPQPIAQADKCDGYNIDRGCQRWNQPLCRHHHKYGYTVELNRGYFVSEDDSSYNISDTNLGISDCKVSCWDICCCVAYTSLFANRTGCKIWTNISYFVPSDLTYLDLVYILSPRLSHSGLNVGKNKWVWIGIAISASALLVTFFCILCYLRRRRTVELQGVDNEIRDEDRLLSLVISERSINANEIPNDRKKVPDINVYSYECISTATNNFSLESKLGEGGFGPVYMGKLPTNQKIDVKRLSRNLGQGIIEFKNELILISRLQHINLVKLLGCCIFGEERMLIYEYMPNKSLDYFLFDSNRSKLLDWKKRFNIIEGIAQGFIYLHKYSRLRVIHRDLKASNILLDENMNPKISDFGMARIFKLNELEANTNRIVGTYGYMSPELAMEGVFSTKSDVYSFGVLMLEIVSGRRSNSFYHSNEALNLVGYVWGLWQADKGLDLVDPTISDSCVNNQVLRCIQVSLLCVEDGAIDRPTMSDMLSMLTNESTKLPLPKKPAFSIARKQIEANIPNKESNIYTMNGLSISDMDAR